MGAHSADPKHFDGYTDPTGQQREVERRQVMKRIGRPEDIGYAAAFWRVMKPPSSPERSFSWTAA